MGFLFWRFNRVSKKFSKNRERFLEIAQSWEAAGKAKNANTARETIKKIESMISELSAAFSNASTGSFRCFLKLGD